MEEEKAVVGNSKLHAVLAGCNYPAIRAMVLHACHNDVHVMHNALITRFGAHPKNIVAMIDKPGNTKMPTKDNIEAELKKMISRSKSGDTLFFFFSGHGMLYPSEGTGRLEPVIVTCEDNHMTCMEFRTIVDMVPKDVTFTILSDSCNSGGLIDKEPLQVGPRHHLDQDLTASIVLQDGTKPKMITHEAYLAHLSSVTGLDSADIGVHMLHMFGDRASLMYRVSPDRYPKALKPDQGILVSGCERNESCVIDPDNVSAFTKVVLEILKKNGAFTTNKQLVVMARKILGSRPPDSAQHPCLYSSNKNADAIFLGKPSPGINASSSSVDDI